MNYIIPATMLHLKQALENLLKQLSKDKLAISIASQPSIVKLLNEELENPELILSLTHYAEDSAARNISFGAGKTTAPALRLNFLLMISAPFSDHLKAWEHLEAVLGYFRKNPLINVDGREIALELFSMSFAESNLMWSALGGRKYPYLLYKLKGIELED